MPITQEKLLLYGNSYTPHGYVMKEEDLAIKMHFKIRE